MTWFEGHRTYIIAGAMAIINFICVMGWFCFTAQQLLALDGMMGAIGLIFVRASVAKVQNAVEKSQ